MAILSEIVEVVACAQQEPQYWGMCWFLVVHRKFVPLTFPQLQLAGREPSISLGVQV